MKAYKVIWIVYTSYDEVLTFPTKQAADDYRRSAYGVRTSVPYKYILEDCHKKIVRSVEDSFLFR